MQRAALQSLLTACLALSLGACATTPEETGTGRTKTHYVLKVGDEVPFPQPLPTLTKIKVDWHYSDGSMATVDGYRGWDFNGDDRFDMVEVLAEDGGVQKRVFDFDGDGRIDLVK